MPKYVCFTITACMLVMWLCRYWWGMLLCATYRRWCGPGVLRPWVRRYPWHQQQTGSQQTISKARTTICISARRGMQETQSGKLTHFRRPCSDSRHVTAPYKLSFFIIIIIIFSLIPHRLIMWMLIMLVCLLTAFHQWQIRGGRGSMAPSTCQTLQ